MILAMSTHDQVTAPGKKRILIVDDHEAIRSVLTSLLNEEPDLTVTATVESAEEALIAVQRQPVDLAIVDISLGQMNGLDLTRQLRLEHPDIRVLILSMHDPAIYGDRAVQAGASGYVAKQDASETLLHAIHRVVAGRTYFPNDKRIT